MRPPLAQAGVQVVVRAPPGVEAAAIAEGRALMQQHPLQALQPDTQRTIGHYLFAGNTPPSQFPSPSVSLRSGSEELEFDEQGRPIYLRHPPGEEDGKEKKQ